MCYDSGTVGLHTAGMCMLHCFARSLLLYTNVAALNTSL